MDYRNRSGTTLWFAGTPYEPGALIPATVDPAQLSYFVATGAVEATTAPPLAPDPLRRVSSSPLEVTDGDDGPL